MEVESADDQEDHGLDRVEAREPTGTALAAYLIGRQMSDIGVTSLVYARSLGGRCRRGDREGGVGHPIHGRGSGA